MNIGGYIRKIRNQQGKTLKQVAKDVQISYSFLSQIETGDRGISTDLIRKIAKALDVPDTELLVVAGLIDERTALDEITLKIHRLNNEIENINAKVSRFHQRKSSSDNLGKQQVDILIDELHDRKLILTHELMQYEKERDRLEKNSQKFKDPFEQNLKDRYVSFKVPLYEENLDENSVVSTFALSPEESKRRFLDLENLLTMEEDISLNTKILSSLEKERALKILKLVFENETEHD